MPSFSLAVYTLQVRTKGHRQTERLGSFGNPPHDLLPVLTRYLNALRNAPDRDEQHKKVMETTAVNLNGRELTGTIDHGEWGYATTGKNFRTLRINYNRNMEDFEPFPFYYLFSVPQDARLGFVILQRYGHVGIRQQLLDYFLRHFVVDHPTFSMNVTPAVPRDLVEQYTGAGATVKKVRFFQHRLPRNFEDRYADPDTARNGAYSEYIIHAKQEGLPIIGDIRNAVQNRPGAIARLLEVAPIASERVKVSIEVNGKPRSLEIGETTKMRAYYDISDQVEIGRNGLPVFASINDVAHGLLLRQQQDAGQQ
jgi:hypothetical protein